MPTNDRWSALSMKDKASLIKMMVDNGITSLDDMKFHYNNENLYEDGGGKNKQRAIQYKEYYKRPENSSLIQDLAYRIGSDEKISQKGGADIVDIVKALKNKNVEIDDNKYAYIFGTGDRYPEIKEEINGFDYKPYIEKNKYKDVKNVYGVINPYNEYHLDPKYENLVRELAKHGYHFYDNADDMFIDADEETFGYRDDVGNFIHKFGIDNNGNVVLHDSDIYDFNPADYNYARGLMKPFVKAEAAIMDKVGTPYIIRQENQPVVFDGYYYTGNNITNHLDNLTDEDIAKITGAGLLEPAYIYKRGGSIHINPKNKGKFNATKKRTGKTTEELTHSKNPLTRRRAIFAQNAKRWNHKHAEGGPLGDVDTLNHPKYNEAKEEAIFNYLTNNGLNDAQAAGLMGNLAVESLLNADINQFNGPAYGLMQAEGPRKTAVKNYSGTPYVFGSNLSPEEQKQLDYIIDIGINNYTPGEWGRQGYSGARAARKDFLDTSDVEKASDIITRNYLRPSKPRIDRRRAMSNYYYDKYSTPDFVFGNSIWNINNFLNK